MWNIDWDSRYIFILVRYSWVVIWRHTAIINTPPWHHSSMTFNLFCCFICFFFFSFHQQIIRNFTKDLRKIIGMHLFIDWFFHAVRKHYFSSARLQDRVFGNSKLTTTPDLQSCNRLLESCAITQNLFISDCKIRQIWYL